MVELAPDFDEFFGSLIGHSVEFLIVGAYALAYHGAPRYTGDIDVFLRPTTENASRLLAGAFRVRVSALQPGARAGHRAFAHHPDGRGARPDSRHERHQRGDVGRGVGRPGTAPCGSHDLPFIGRAEFIRNKRAAGRLKDLADIEALEG